MTRIHWGRRFGTAVAALGVLLASGCNVVRMREASLERRYARATLLESKFETDRAVVAYRDGGAKGEKTPVLLLHGYGASAIWQWPDQMEALAPTRRVIVPDLLWFGGSYAKGPAYRIGDQVSAMSALLDELGVSEIDVVGVSYGGLVAHELAAAEPHRVRRLVLVDSPGRQFSPEEYDAMCDRFGVESAVELLIPTDEDDVQRLFEIAYQRPPPAPAWARRQVVDGLYGVHVEEKAALIEALLLDFEAVRAQPMPQPQASLVVWGEHDPIFPLATGRSVAESLSARLEVIPEARHAPNVEHPRVFNEMLLEFLDAPDAERPSSGAPAESCAGVAELRPRVNPQPAGAR